MATRCTSVRGSWRVAHEKKPGGRAVHTQSAAWRFGRAKEPWWYARPGASRTARPSAGRIRRVRACAASSDAVSIDTVPAFSPVLPRAQNKEVDGRSVPATRRGEHSGGAGLAPPRRAGEQRVPGSGSRRRVSSGRVSLSAVAKCVTVTARSGSQALRLVFRSIRACAPAQVVRPWCVTTSTGSPTPSGGGAPPPQHEARKARRRAVSQLQMKAQSQSHAVRISSEFSQKISDPKWPSGRFCKMIFAHDTSTNRGGKPCRRA